MTPFNEREKAMSEKLAECASNLSKCRSALNTIVGWADPVEATLSTEAELRERMTLIQRYANEAKDIGL